MVFLLLFDTLVTGTENPVPVVSPGGILPPRTSVSPLTNPEPIKVIVTPVTAPPETTIVA